MKHYQIGDRCPCCGQILADMSAEMLELFSQICHVAGLEELETSSFGQQEMDAGILTPPDAGINPPIKPIRKW